MAPEISDLRKTVYYLGMALMIIGGLFIFSAIYAEITQHVNRTVVLDNGYSKMWRVFSGMALVAVGQMMRRVAARGLAGSGVLLDPEQAREDLEPYSRMAGGMVQDALDEADVAHGAAPQPLIMIKCRACEKLNTADAKFCQECGKKL